MKTPTATFLGRFWKIWATFIPTSGHPANDVAIVRSKTGAFWRIFHNNWQQKLKMYRNKRKIRHQCGQCCQNNLEEM